MINRRDELTEDPESGISFTVASPRKRLLVCDDDIWICDVLTRVLTHNQYEVVVSHSAEQALLCLTECAFDLALCDMMLPGMNGLEFTARAAALCPHLPIVLITARNELQLMREALQLGASDFVTKPFSIETVSLIVERNLERQALETRRSEGILFSTVQALAAAMDAREPFTAEHSRRVALLADVIGEEMALAEEERNRLRLAALVHDVGKIATPDTVLHKPGPLNNEEWQLIRLHPEQGADIISRVPQLNAVAEAVRHHHEWMNGSGYPDGLAGEEIPLLSRVISVADAYEVMTSNRVYQPRLPEEQAKMRLQESADTQFDVAVVNAFLHLPPSRLPF